MRSLWSDADAERMAERYAQQGIGRDLALRVYTSRLLGGEPKLVLHGGGNTSVKTVVKDLLDEEVEALCVKGSGWDMAAIEPAGLPAVRLAPLRKLRGRARALGRGDGAGAACQPDRSWCAQPLGRDPAARLFAAQIRRSHALDGGLEPSRPARCGRALRRSLRRSARARALHHAGLQARQEGRRDLRGGRGRRRLGSIEARHLHLRRQRRGSLRADDIRRFAGRRKGGAAPHDGVRRRPVARNGSGRV